MANEEIRVVPVFGLSKIERGRVAGDLVDIVTRNATDLQIRARGLGRIAQPFHNTSDAIAELDRTSQAVAPAKRNLGEYETGYVVKDQELTAGYALVRHRVLLRKQRILHPPGFDDIIPSLSQPVDTEGPWVGAITTNGPSTIVGAYRALAQEVSPLVWTLSPASDPSRPALIEAGYSADVFDPVTGVTDVALGRYDDGLIDRHSDNSRWVRVPPISALFRYDISQSGSDL